MRRYRCLDNRATGHAHYLTSVLGFGCNPTGWDRTGPDGTSRPTSAKTPPQKRDAHWDRTGPDGMDLPRSIFEDAINRIAAAGITKGCNPPTNDLFCPDQYVTRGEMATFLVRALGL